MNPGPACGNLGQDAAEQIPAAWRVYSVAQSRPMDITIRRENFRHPAGFWNIEDPPYGVVVEEAKRTLYSGLLTRTANSNACECAIAQPGGAVIAFIREDWQKRRAGTKKWLGFIEYKSPKPEFVVTGAGGAEFCRIETFRDAAASRHYAIYRMAFAGVQYRLQETSGSGWAYNMRWAIFCEDKREAETTRLGWNGVMLHRVELSLTSSEHLPAVVLLILTWWIEREPRGQVSGG